ncbi:hypothetical protein VULLAG_LOCUS18830 [Vulpes lagopus]
MKDTWARPSSLWPSWSPREQLRGAQELAASHQHEAALLGGAARAPRPRGWVPAAELGLHLEEQRGGGVGGLQGAGSGEVGGAAGRGAKTRAWSGGRAYCARTRQGRGTAEPRAQELARGKDPSLVQAAGSRGSGQGAPARGLRKERGRCRRRSGNCLPTGASWRPARRRWRAGGGVKALLPRRRAAGRAAQRLRQTPRMGPQRTRGSLPEAPEPGDRAPLLRGPGRSCPARPPAAPVAPQPRAHEEGHFSFSTQDPLTFE